MIDKKHFEQALINCLLRDLHNQQLDMINEVVDKSDMREANEVIKYIMEKK